MNNKKANRKNNLLRIFLWIAGFAAAWLCAVVLLKDDCPVFLRFYAVILAIGFAAFFLLAWLFQDFADSGWLFAKVIGLGLGGWVTWLLSSVCLVPFRLPGCLLGIGAVLAAGLIVWIGMYRKGRRLSLNVDRILGSELLFFVFFLFWTYLRGFNPEASGTEKFMDYGFMTAILRSDYMPAADLWYSGGTLNYYYVGQFFACYLTRLSGVTAGEGYNLMMAMLAAFGFALPYSLSRAVMQTALADRAEHNEKAAKLPVISGVLSGAAVSLCGNMHYPIYKWIVPQIRSLLGLETDSYWFPDATRYIGYNPDTHDKTIHEFPLYSYVLSDLHAHVINTIFVMALLGVLFAWLLYRRETIRKGEEAMKSVSWVREALHPAILLAGFFIGLFHMTNYWDFPIYFVVTGAVILFSNAVLTGFSLNTIKLTALHALVVTGIGELVALPFTLSFDTISTEIGIAVNHTPLYQILVLWGLPFLAVGGLLVFLLCEFFDRENREKRTAAAGKKKRGAQPAAGKKRCELFRFIGGLETADLFILTIGLCAAGLILIPELVYVKDIYTGDYLRANTMFKLTYQAFILFGISMGYIIVKYLCGREKRSRRILAGICLALLIWTGGYFGEAVGAWYGNIFDPSGYQTLEASCYLEERMADDKVLIDWLNENVEGTPVILEADGDSYTDYGRISVNTGLPTVLGWYVHEWLWRGDTESLNVRKLEIETIYTSQDEDEVMALIEKYEIAYLVVGQLEIDKYGAVNHELLQSLGSIAASSGSSYLVKIE